MYKVPHFIGNQAIFEETHLLNIHNPAKGEVIGQAPVATNALIDQAVSVAVNAFPSWSRTPVLKRARLLSNFKLLLEKNKHEIAAMITREHGKTLDDALGSIQRGIDVVEFACSLPGFLRGSYAENVSSGIDSYSMRQPLGVCVGITPFNFPAMIPLWMFPIAITCGNTFVLKPSEKDPSSAVKFAELAHEAGIPSGVLNVVHGDHTTVQSLITHEKVQAISFVGSLPVAEHVYHTGTSHNKRVQAFAGAKNHCIVMPDADLDQTVEALVGAAFGSAGERCMAISVVVTVGDDMAETLLKYMKTRIANLKIGAGDTAVEMGPLISKEHLAKVKSYVDLGVKEGATLVIDGRDFSLDNGFYMKPCLFDHVKTTMRIYREEIFGPVLCVVRAKNFEEALQYVNDHPFGNGAAIFTRDGEVAHQFATRVQAGMVGINVSIPVPFAYHSFGGWKRSMFGDVTMHGPESIAFFTKLKTVTQRWTASEKNKEFIMPTHE